MFNRFMLACMLPIALSILPSAGVAQGSDPIHFTLEPGHRDAARIQVRFESGDSRNHNSWSTGMPPSDLAGLDLSSFHTPGTRPLRFSVIREAGRLDCVGRGGESHAWGNCSFAADPVFVRLLQSHAIPTPTRDQAFSLMAVNVRRELVEAMTAAQYPPPTIGNLTALAALGVDGNYIASMRRAGYRPSSIESLVQFKAMGITPEWIGGFVRIGYANVPGDGLVQLRALGITPDYIAGFQRIGYRNLPVDTLIQLKALNISPDFVRAVVKAGEPMPSIDHLVRLKLFSDRH
jgi:hypothetical protein